MKSGPWKNSSLRRPDCGSSSMISVPMISEGIRSGVNSMRRKSICRLCAMDLAISVLPSPGTPIIERVAATKEGGQELVQNIVLPDHDLRDRRSQVVSGLFEPLDCLNLLLGRFALRLLWVSCHEVRIRWLTSLSGERPRTGFTGNDQRLS